MKDEYDFSIADRFVETNNMFIIDHTLIWYLQALDWVFVDELIVDAVNRV